MKPGNPWSVKGIEPEARAVAKRAAREAGTTLGEWLNSRILNQSESGDADPYGTAMLQERSVSSTPRSRQGARAEPSPVGGATAPEQRPDSALTLQLIARQLADLAERQPRGGETRRAALKPGLDDDHSELAGLAVLIEENDRKTVEALNTVNSRLSLLSQQISRLMRSQAFDRPSEVPGYGALEGAIRNVVERVEMSEKRTRESLSFMHEKLSAFADRRRPASGDDDKHRAPPLPAGFDRHLTDMLNRIEQVESLLAERIESVRVAAQQMANQAQTAAVLAARGELRELESRLLAAFQDALQSAGPPAVLVADIEALRADIASLARRHDELSAAMPAERDIESLRIALEQMSARVAQGPDPRSIADLDKRFGDINRRLDDAMQPKDDQSALEALQQKVDSVTGRVAKTEVGLAQLETMERSIRQIYASLDDMRGAARLAGAGPSPELAALAEGLKALRESAGNAEGRSQETWRAMQDTLSRIVDRVAALEANATAVGTATSTPLVRGGASRALPPVDDDFIAAARRAAQAAALAPKASHGKLDVISAPSDEPPPPEPGFFGRLRRKTGTGMTAASHRNTLLFAGLVVLLGATYFAFQTLTRPQQAADQAGRLPAASTPVASLAGPERSDAFAQPPRASRSGPRAAASAFDLASAVPEARALLARLGLGVSGVGEHMDSRLANAIRLFELRSGLKVTGNLTPSLLEKLRQQIA